jgi:uncharacterized protein (DUF983 family)
MSRGVLTDDSKRRDPVELDPRRGGRMMKRALLLRCPYCGSRGVLNGWLTMRTSCPACRLRLDRGERDFFIGAYLVNLIVAELVAAALIAGTVAAFWPDVPWSWLLRVGVVLMVVMPFLFFPFSRLVWLAVDLTFQPPVVRDFDDPIDAAESPDRYSRS